MMIDFLESWISEVSGQDQGILDNAKQRAEISLAGAALRRLRSQPEQLPPRRWTGRIGHGRRGYIGQAVILPGPILAKLLAARRGWAAVAWVDPFAVRSRRIGYVEAAAVQPYRHPAAVALGARKKGVVERRSAKKANAARRNGHCPVRRGSRPRGRPRTRYSPSLATTVL
jgi:hypothetical protein